MKLSSVLLSLCLLPGFAFANGADHLQTLAPTLSPDVVGRAYDAILCAQDAGQVVDKLIVVDMGMKSTDKRLWAFDLSGSDPDLILNALVAHGAGSDRNGDGKADKFSNTPDSHMTSLGLYKIGEQYRGKNGLSRKLDGLFKRFNSKARDRAVVMHPSNYVNPGRVGRSQGCPAVNPKTMVELEKAGLKNAVLWIDGPDQALIAEVEACARKREQRLQAEMLALVEEYVGTEPPVALGGFNSSIDMQLIAHIDPQPAMETAALSLDWEWDRFGKGQSVVQAAVADTATTPKATNDLADGGMCPTGGVRDQALACRLEPLAIEFDHTWLRPRRSALQRMDDDFDSPRTNLRERMPAADGAWGS